jgi:type II secretory pathway component PulK
MNCRRELPNSATREASGGYVMLMALVVLVLLSLVATRFGGRVDAEREQARRALEEAETETVTRSVLASTLYWLSTARINQNGVGDGVLAQWIADGRWYRLGPRVWASLQDERGLISVNHPGSRALRQLLLNEGVDARDADRLLDVLADYVDSDDLRRLNGAEKAEYVAQGLAGPRNDYLRSVEELCQLPVWSSRQPLCEALLPALSIRVAPLINPNTSSMKVIAALLPNASAGQLQLFETLRKTAPFLDGAAATARTGLSLDVDDYMFHASDEFRLRVWVEGQPRAREYNLRVLPGGAQAPWQVISSKSVPMPKFADTSGPAFEPLYTSLSLSFPEK